MESITIINQSNQNIISSQGAMANGFIDRLKGLMGKRGLNKDEGLCIKPCNSIHMFFMRFAIDVVFVDKEDHVCLLVPSLKPWSMIPYVKGASYVLELPEGTIHALGIQHQHHIIIEKRIE